MLVVLEGIDCCGKSSVAEAVGTTFGMKVSAFPRRESVTGIAIDSYLNSEWDCGGLRPDEHLSALAFQALMLVNRIEVWDDLKRASSILGSESLVLARYWQSGYVYGQVDGLSPEWLLKIHEPLPKANLNIFLDVPPALALKRLGERGKKIERYENKLAGLELAAKLYRQLWTAQSTSKDWWLMVDASHPLENVIEDVCALVKRVARRIGDR